MMIYNMEMTIELHFVCWIAHMRWWQRIHVSLVSCQSWEQQIDSRLMLSVFFCWFVYKMLRFLTRVIIMFDFFLRVILLVNTFNK